MRQEYSLEFLQKIADAYARVDAIREHRLFTSGYENTNYFIRTDTGSYVIKIFEGTDVDPKMAAYEVSIMDVSYRSGVQTPRVFENITGALTTECESKTVMVMEYLDGENVSGKRLTEAFAEKVGTEMGKMDTVLAQFPDEHKTRQGYEFDLKNFPALEKDTALLAPEHRDMFKSVFDLFSCIETQFRTFPAGIIHNDVVRHNILARGGIFVGIIDFSDLAFSPYIQNVAVTLAQAVFSGTWQPELAASVIRGYRKYHPLSDEEISALYALTLARRAELVLAFLKWNQVFEADAERNALIARSYGIIQKLLDMGRKTFHTILDT